MSRRTLSCAASAAVSQPGRYAVDGELDPVQNLVARPAHDRLRRCLALRLVAAMGFQQLDLHMVQRVEIGEAVADGAVKEGIAFQ
ncbi:hypothetical protein QP64_00090, partial [Staphylococcus aureus]